MKIKDVLEQYGDWEVNEEDLQSILSKPAPKTVFDLEKGDIFYRPAITGKVVQETYHENTAQKNVINSGNAYLDIDECAFAMERAKTMTELKKRGVLEAHELKKYFAESDSKLVQLICLKIGRNKFGVDYIDYKRSYFDMNGGYFGYALYAPKNKVKEIINEVGEERILNYIFGVTNSLPFAA